MNFAKARDSNRIMPLPEDSRPFAVLKQHVADFKSGFDEDIEACLVLLDSKLSALIRDPGTVNTSSKDGSRLSVDIQFTRAKYDVYVHIKSLFDEFESSWKEQLEEMKSSFLENVEILLAKTKLDEKVFQNDTKKSSKARKEGNESPAANTSSLSPYSLLVKAKRLPSSVFNTLLPQTNDADENGYSMNDAASKSPVQSQSSSLQSHKTLIKRTPSPKKTQVQNTEVLDERVSNMMDQDDDDDDSEEIIIQEIATARSNRSRSRNSNAPKPTPTRQSTAVLTPRRSAAKGKGRKSILKPDSLVESELHTTPSRSTRKRTAGKDTNVGASDVMECEETEYEEVAPKTPKNVHFSVGLNVHEDLEIYSPEINLTRSAPRRKTVMAEVAENIRDVSLTPNITRTKSKRKTICAVMENVPVAPSPKRFKSSRNSSIATASEAVEEDADLSRSESSSAGHYTPWVLLDDLDGKVPAQPGVYELKVYKAKKSAYIGSCDNLRHKLTLHKIGQNSGHKHLDKFLERNKKDVQVRYEIMPSTAQAKNEEMKRIKSFVEEYRTTPSYN